MRSGWGRCRRSGSSSDATGCVEVASRRGWLARVEPHTAPVNAAAPGGERPRPLAAVRAVSPVSPDTGPPGGLICVLPPPGGCLSPGPRSRAPRGSMPGTRPGHRQTPGQGSGYREARSTRHQALRGPPDPPVAPAGPGHRFLGWDRGGQGSRVAGVPQGWDRAEWARTREAGYVGFGNGGQGVRGLELFRWIHIDRLITWPEFCDTTLSRVVVLSVVAATRCNIRPLLRPRCCAVATRLATRGATPADDYSRGRATLDDIGASGSRAAWRAVNIGPIWVA